MNDKVSVVIPVYNTEDYVEESIKSALNQSYSNLEIITIDDGSTDNSLEILQNYSDKITVIPIKHSGQPAALNVGVKKMTGSWFKLLGADDVLYPNAIEELVLTSNEFKDKKHWIFVSNFHMVDPKGNVLYELHEPAFNSMSQFDFNVLLLDTFVGNIITSLIHKSTIDQYGMFNEKFKRVQDYELWLRYCLIHNVHMHFIPKVLAKNRWHEKTLTNTLPKKDIRREEKEVKEHILSKLDPTLRQRYEIALHQHRNQSLIFRTFRLATFLYNSLPNQTSQNFVKKYLHFFHSYEKLRCRVYPNDNLEI